MGKFFCNIFDLIKLVNSLNAKGAGLTNLTPFTTKSSTDLRAYFLNIIAKIKNPLLYYNSSNPLIFVNQNKITISGNEVIAQTAAIDNRWTWSDIVTAIGTDPTNLLDQKKFIKYSLSKTLDLLIRIDELLSYQSHPCKCIVYIKLYKTMRKAARWNNSGDYTIYTNGTWTDTSIYGEADYSIYDTADWLTETTEAWPLSSSANRTWYGYRQIDSFSTANNLQSVYSVGGLGETSACSSNYKRGIDGQIWWYEYSYSTADCKLAFVKSTSGLTYENIDSAALNVDANYLITVTKKEISRTAQKPPGGSETVSQTTTYTNPTVTKNGNVFVFQSNPSVLYDYLRGGPGLLTYAWNGQTLQDTSTFDVQNARGDTGNFYYIKKFDKAF